MNYKKQQVNDVLNAFWTIEEALRAYAAADDNANKIYSRYIDIVKQYIKEQRDRLQ